MQARALTTPIQLQSHQIEMAKQGGIHFPTVLPLFKSPPDEKALDAWVESHHLFPGVKDIAKKISKNLNYISFEEFFTALTKTLADFNQQLKDEEYVLWVTQTDNSGKLREGCSDAWVAGLSLEHGNLRWPKSIVTTDTIAGYLKLHPDVKNVLILDDASYTATHIHTELSLALTNNDLRLDTKFEGVKLFVGLPFLTSHAEKIIGNVKTFDIVILEHAVMKMLKEILSPEEIQYLNAFSRREDFCGRRTLTYFDHAYPDDMSTMQNFLYGGQLFVECIGSAMKSLGFKLPWESASATYKDEDTWNNLVVETLGAPRCVATIVQPYKVCKQSCDELKYALEHNKMGKRTQYPLPARLKTALVKFDIQIPPEVKPESNEISLRQGHTLFQQYRKAKKVTVHNASHPLFCPPVIANALKK